LDEIVNVTLDEIVNVEPAYLPSLFTKTYLNEVHFVLIIVVTITVNFRFTLLSNVLQTH